MQVYIQGRELLAAASIASKKADREILQHLLVEVNPHSYRIVATDSYKLVVIDHDIKTGEDGRFLVPPEAMQNIKATDTIKFDVADGELVTATIVRVDKTVTSQYICNFDSKQYPIYQNLMYGDGDTSTNNDVYVNNDYLLTMTQTVKKVFGRDAVVEITCHERLKPIEIKARNNDVMFTGLIMPLRS